MDYEDIQLENALFPWLESDCMADETQDMIYYDLDYDYEEEEEDDDVS